MFVLIAGGMTTLVSNTGSSQGNYNYSTFSNISAISLWPCLLLEKTRVLWEINYLYLICHTHTGYLLPHNTETRSVLLSLRLPRFQCILTSYIFFQFPSVLLQKYELQQFVRNICCIHNELQRKIKNVNYGEKIKTLTTEEDWKRWLRKHIKNVNYGGRLTKR